MTASDDVSKIAVQLEDAGFLFSGEAVLDNDFMSTIFGASVKKVTHDCKPLMRKLFERGIPADFRHVDSREAAKALPCVFNNCAVFYDGVFQTVNLPDAAWLRRLLKR